MRKLKSLFAVIMAMAMMFAMSSVALAATSYPNLTGYDTDYAYNVSADEDSVITLKVVPASADYKETGAFTKEQAEAIEWDAALLSDEDMIFIAPVDPVAIDGGYAAAAEVYVFAGATPGPNSFYAKNAEGNTMSFTVVVDGYAAPVTGIKAVYFDGDTEKASASGMTVAYNDHYGDTGYPSVLDAVYQSRLATSAISAYVINNRWGDYALQSLTFAGGTALENKSIEQADGTWEYIGWQYRVYRNGEMVAVSANIGADQFKLENNDVIVWKYGTYDIAFPESYK